MHGREGENWKRGRHMRSVPTTTRTVAGDSVASAVDSFCKDGRRIRVGDCALFKSLQDSPPFIGIIRWLASSKGHKLQIGVNWLYRSAEVKLGKGILLDAAPNEIFYSFHKDEISSASLLHPCKVAFLPKGVELPSGISSFVCRQVYDIANKCLWWLTDQDYIDEHQEEVDLLLYKTRIEMHATVQPGGGSPKPINGPTSMSQLKAGSDGVLNNSTSFPSQIKGKKRERGDQSSDPSKRERSSRIDDSDSGQFKAEITRSEIAKITEKGGLIDSEGVEKLVQLMQPDRVERKMDLICRAMLAGVVAATEKFDCLNQFVQLRGLPVLDKWLQDIHKGKIGYGSSPKDGDKSAEEFLLVLLRALDKLPVNLQALQMCNIGKSVNHLRSHKNLDIQRKARSLVDTWKKRVEAEMNIIDSKSGPSQPVPWPSKSHLPDVSHGVNRQPSGSSDIVVKSSVTQLPTSKSASVKPFQAETTAKSASSSPGPLKSVLLPASVKECQMRVSVGSASDLPLTMAREEKSSSSSQSHNYSQSLSGKEDARSSTAGSMSVNKISTVASRRRKSNNGFPGSAISAVQRDTSSSRSSSLHKSLVPEKVSQSGLTSEKAVDVPIMEGNNHKLIVKIPTQGRSPAQSATGASFEDPSNMHSRAASPVLSEKHDQFDRSLKEKDDSFRSNIASDVNTESWQSNDFKDALTGSDEGDGSPATMPDEERSRSAEDNRKMTEVSKAASSSSGNDLKSGKSHETSFSSINALIESCVKYSEANALISVEDDVGMNLLASVAAREMSRSDLVSPIDSPRRNIPIVEDTCTGDDAKSKSSPGDNLAVEQSQLKDNAGADGDTKKQDVIAGGSSSMDGLHHYSKDALADFSTDRKNNSLLSEEMLGDRDEHLNCSNIGMQPTADSCSEANERSDEIKVASLVVPPGSREEIIVDAEVSKQLHNKSVLTGSSVDGILEMKTTGISSSVAKDKVDDAASSIQDKNQAVEVSSACPSKEFDGGNACDVSEGSNVDGHVVQKPPAVTRNDDLGKDDGKELPLSGSGKGSISGNSYELKAGKADQMDNSSYVADRKGGDQEIGDAPAMENQVLAGSVSDVTNQKSRCMEADVESKEVVEHCSGGIGPDQKSPSTPAQEKQHLRLRESQLTGGEADVVEECASMPAGGFSSSATEVADTDTKLKFDLNEGLVVDDGRCGETLNLTSPGCSSVQLINSLPFPVSSLSSSLPASITVAAAAKGPFVPPEDLLRSRGEIGWKGSAATSAFRPAEPRKSLEMPLGATNHPTPDATANNHSRTFLDIDLNVPDEGVLDDMPSCDSVPETCSTSDTVYNCDVAPKELMGSASVHSVGGLDLDLNRVDEANDVGHCSTSSSWIPSLLSVKMSSSTGLPNDGIRRDFDLNDGPTLDDANAELSSFAQPGKGCLQFQPPVDGLRISNTDVGNCSSWFTPGSVFSNIPIPSILPDRGEQPFPIIAAGGPQRILGPAGAVPFTPDVYRGSVLSATPAVPFPSAAFQYPVFPFGTTSFPLPSSSFSGGSTTHMDSASSGRLGFPAIHSQLLGPAGAVSSNFPRPYVVSLPDGRSFGSAENNRKWGMQGLDLNAGPGGLDIEVKDETLPLASRPLSFASSQALAVEQGRMHQVASGILRRKEPEGGRDSEGFRYKQSSWQS